MDRFLNRRNIIAAATVAAIPSWASAETTDQSEVVTMLIEEVIRDGDMSNLQDIVTEDVAIPVLGVSDIAAFEEVSIAGYDARESEFKSIDMSITSLAENSEWVHALVKVEGELRTGRMQSLALFYVAEFRDGLISRLYFG